MPSQRSLTRLAAVLAAAVLVSPAPAVARERADIPTAYTWNLAELYPNDAAWEAARAAFAAKLPGLARHKGHLGDSADALHAALDESSARSLEVYRLVVYASARSDEDTRAARTREMKQAAEQLGVDLGEATAWMRPGFLSVDAGKLRGYLADRRLAPWRFYVEDVLRGKAHTLDGAGEALLAGAANLANAGQTTYGILKDAELPWPTVTFTTGEVRLDPAAFALQRSSKVRADREAAFAGFFGALKRYEGTFGSTLDAQLKAHVFEARARHFSSALEAALFGANVPTTVYTQLVTDVRASLPTLHRYLGLRKRMLGLDKLRYQDLYAPLVGEVDLAFGPEEGRKITLDAFAPLGKDYVSALAKGYESRWTDFLPSTGKRPGAYSTGVYGVHPYQLLNYNGKYEDLTTLAHESGHSMHTFLAYQKQPFPTAEYPIFVAEVASTLNENLLLHHMLGKAKDDGTRLALLGNALEGLRTTLFRQTLFAEFELEIHRRAEQGAPLTGEALSALYLGLVRAYYGHAAGACEVDDLVAIEWAFVPHFYYDYYVFQYATSIVASTSLARTIRDEAKAGKATAARDRYLAMLAAGGSRYPVDLLRDAGVDMTTPKPFAAAMAEMNAIMDDMERILARRKPGKK